MQLLKDDASTLPVLNMTDIGNKRIPNCRKSLSCPQTNMRDRPEPQRGGVGGLGTIIFTQASA